jgi:hypothetical protein
LKKLEAIKENNKLLSKTLWRLFKEKIIFTLTYPSPAPKRSFNDTLNSQKTQKPINKGTRK